MSDSLKTLLTSLIDYAGLFPPARLDMPKAVESYARDLRSDHAWMLARFICPVSRLDELTQHAASLMPGTHATSGYREYADIMEAWPISAIIDGPLDACIDRIGAFNEHHSTEDNGLAIIDAIELKATDGQFIDDAIDVIPDEIYPFFEIPAMQDPRGLIAALAGTASAAKIRTGGITPDAFPSPAQVAGFITACHLADVPFKATAGLHHPLRAEYNLTYEPDCPRGVMHGFVNLFMTAAAVRTAEVDEQTATEMLEDTNAESFRFEDGTAIWRDVQIQTAQLARTRESFALSYGSCSFAEPVEDLKGLGLL